MSVGSPTAGTWSSSPWRLDNEFEMDRRGSADRAAVDGGRGPLNGRLVGHYGPIIPRFASVSGPHPARRQAPRRPTPRDPAASAEPATAPPKTTQIATGGAGGLTPDATQRCFNPEFSERIGNSRRTGSSSAYFASCDRNLTMPGEQIGRTVTIAVKRDLNPEEQSRRAEREELAWEAEEEL